MPQGKTPESKNNAVSSNMHKIAYYEYKQYADKRKSYEETLQAHLARLRKEDDAEDLQSKLAAIELTARNEGWSIDQLKAARKAAAAEVAEYERDLENRAHAETMRTLKTRFETQNVSVRVQAAHEMQQAQKIHADKLKQQREEMEARRRQMNEEGASTAEKRKLTADIKKITQQEEAERAKIKEWEKQEAFYAKVKADAEFQRASAAKKVELTNQEITRLKEEQEKIESELTDRITARKIDLNVLLKKPEEERSDADNQAIERLTAEIDQLEENLTTYSQNYTTATNNLSNQLITLEFSAQHEAALKKLEKTLKTPAKAVAQQKVDATRQKTAEAQLDREARHEYGASAEGKAAERERFAQELEENATDEVLVKTLENLGNQLNQALNQIDGNINQFYQYQASVEARLQGSDESYKKSLKNISKNVGMSGLVSQKEVIENLKKLSEAGIAYNLDLRAFLATIKDDIAETFDVFDSNLMRLIRLQQSDTTAARLGMEASLTRLFNEFFSDTSYLTDAADTVSQAIIDANSQLTKNMSIEFEYMVQKWLGSLYSLGMDSGTISTIAQGLNYLGTGNVEALNGNESLQSLLAMSASRAGISYADILTGGLDADTTNNLMKSMIEYLKSIAENTDNNQVTKSAYSNVFGFSISDLTAVSSLSETDIANIHKQSIDYEGAMDEYEYQASQIFNRTHFSQMLNTVFDNAMMSASTAIGNNAGVYATWKVLNVVEDLTGGIAIPGISVMGNMVDLHQTVTGLAKTGIAGLGLMGSLLGSLFNGSLFGTMDAKKWGYDEFTSRGSATKGISKGTAQGTSESTSMNMVGSSSSSDIKSTSMNDATDEAEEDSKVTNKNVEENGDIYTKIYEAIANEDTTVLQEVINLQNIINDQSLAILDAIGTTNELLRESRRFKAEMSGMDTMLQMLDPSRVFYTAIVSMLPITANQFAMSENKVLTLTDQAIQTAIQATSASVQKNTTEAIEEITSVATDIKEGNYTQLNAAPVIEPNVVVNVTTPVPQVTIEQEDKEDKSPDVTVAAPDITQFGKDTSTAITKLESAISSVDTQNIANLMAQTSVGMHDSNDKTTNQLITNDGLKVSINQMSPEVSAYIAATVKSMVASAITGGITDVDKEGEGVPLIQLLTNLLQSSTLNVNVTNDNFDTALQKSAFTT